MENNNQHLKKEFLKQFKLIKKRIKESKILSKIKNKYITIILGDTGSGKSTFVNYVLGSKLIKKDIGAFIPVIDIKNGEKEFTKIGHSLKNSETQGFSIHSNQNGNLLLLDTQGFFDSRGIDYQIAFSLLLDDIFVNCRGLKFIFTIDYNNFLNTRMAGVKKNFDYIEKLFIEKKYFRKHKNSIMLLITKQDPKITIDEMKKFFLRSGNETQKILQEKIYFYSPLNLEKSRGLLRDEILEKLNNMDYIEEKVFNIPFSIEEKLFLRNLFGIFEKEIFEKTKNKLFLDILTINENLDYFRLRKIKYIKNLLREFDDIITPCLIALESYIIDLKFS